MRIQHNIMAMNAYRNYNNNASALSKNLEKLSSGYKINRAGDDAAGLAISEKMRAQITGLNAASKNVKDGISLVKTAEGAMQEIQDMLNRMDYLATQSANGTYQDEVDREALQKEVNQLRDEINRIADSANFNGIKLLDGSLASTGKASSADFAGWDSIKGALAGGLTDVNATKTKDTIVMANLTAKNAEIGEKLSMSITLEDGSIHDFSLTVKQDENTAANFVFVDDNGKEFSDSTAKSNNLKDDAIGAAFAKQMNESDLGKTYKFSYAGGKITMEAKEAGAAASNIKSVDMKYFNAAGVDTAFSGTNKVAGPSRAAGEFVKGEDAYQALDLSQAKVFDDDTNHTSLEKAVFEINGEKFVFIEKGAVSDENIAKMREAGIEHWVEVGTTSTIKGADVEKMVEKIKHATGLDVGQGKVTTGAWADKSATVADAETFIKISNGESTKAGGGLTLQIGDTSDDYNQLRVSVGDMHTKALGIDKLSIATREDAAAAIQTVKDAINNVSSVRGDLGAYQNRLEHTANNLSVMAENIQDAESTIRDTDVAEEMMSYVKNNILVQSAQAMLAQANQVPQGVLQLLG